jgi:hypothetical protein
MGMKEVESWWQEEGCRDGLSNCFLCPRSHMIYYCTISPSYHDTLLSRGGPMHTTSTQST